MSKYKTFRNLFTRIIPNKRNKIKEEIIKQETEHENSKKRVIEDELWDDWKRFNERIRRDNHK